MSNDTKSPVVPAEAVEAALVVLRDPNFWEFSDTEAVRAMLEAAEPYMRNK
jgi:uncharacterized membrane protein